MRLAYAFLFLAVVAYAAGCTRHALIVPTADGGSSDPCSALTPGHCGDNPACELTRPCGACDPNAAPVCVAKGTVFPCPMCPPACTGLDETQCKADSRCRADYCLECSCTPTFVGCAVVGSPALACPGLGCDPPGCSCAGLDASTCAATAGCTPNYCVGCNGVQSFSGCTGPNQGAPACITSCDCHNSNECGGTVCVVPGGTTCGGACRASCTVDSDCGAGNVCDVASCACSGPKACLPSCVNVGCDTGETCGSDGHCTASACSSPSQCPAFFDCVFLHGASSHCARRACTSDGACGPGGFCVDGGCYGALGSCQAPIP